MSEESAKAFVTRMKTDEAFAKRIAEAETKEDRRAIAQAEGYDFTKDEMQAASGELTVEELDSVAGGTIHDCEFYDEV